MTNITTILKDSGLTATKNRKIVLDLFYQTNRVLSLKEIEANIANMDRISLYRTLKTFVAKELIHKISDGTKHPKYALCHKANHLDDHAHFHCTACEKTICLKQVAIPSQVILTKAFMLSTRFSFIFCNCSEPRLESRE